MEKCKGVWWYLKVEGKYRHHPSRGRLYMLDDAASRKSGNDDALRRCGRCTSPHKLCVKNEAGSPTRGEAPLSTKDALQGSRYGKFVLAIPPEV